MTNRSRSDESSFTNSATYIICPTFKPDSISRFHQNEHSLSKKFRLSRGISKNILRASEYDMSSSITANCSYISFFASGQRFFHQENNSKNTDSLRQTGRFNLCFCWYPAKKARERVFLPRVRHRTIYNQMLACHLPLRHLSLSGRYSLQRFRACFVFFLQR